MAEWSVERIISWSPRRTYHVIVKLCSNNPGKMWNRMLRWKKATNRKAFGGYWYNKPNDKLMAGIVLFEKRQDYLHIHALIAAPEGTDAEVLLHTTHQLFGEGAAIEFTREPDIEGNLCWVARTKWAGEVWIKEIMPEPEDRYRVVNYVLKTLNYDKAQHEDIERQWRVLERG
jgi:hypothetical protein